MSLYCIEVYYIKYTIILSNHVLYMDLMLYYVVSDYVIELEDIMELVT